MTYVDYILIGLGLYSAVLTFGIYNLARNYVGLRVAVSHDLRLLATLISNLAVRSANDNLLRSIPSEDMPSA